MISLKFVLKTKGKVPFQQGVEGNFENKKKSWTGSKSALAFSIKHLLMLENWFKKNAHGRKTTVLKAIWG